jgi:hypothetical protein
LLTTVEIGLTAVTLAGTGVAPLRALNVTLADCPVLIFVASASANPATTSRLDRLERLRKAEDELDEPEDEPVDEEADGVAAAAPEAVAPLPAEPVEPEPDEPDPDEPDPDEPFPPPATVWPTVPLRAVTVPSNGAVRVVSERVF